MTTAATTSPLESYQHGRDNFLAVVLDAVSGLESSVLEFQHQHEGQARLAGSELSEALRAKARFEELAGEQALELEASRAHVCAVPEAKDDWEGDESLAPAPAPAIVGAVFDNAASDSAAVEEAARVIAGLRAELAAEQEISAGLRANLAESTGEISRLDGSLGRTESKLQEATDAHTRYVSETEEVFAQRLAVVTRSVETDTRGEAVRIIEAIAADNPNLAEAADLFTIAFPHEADPADGQNHDASAPAPAAEAAAAPAVDFFANIPAPELAQAPEAVQAAADPQPDETAAAPAPSAEDFFNAVPAPDAETAPEPMTQPLLVKDLEDDAILDPNFFDNPEPLEDPAGEAAPETPADENQAEAPKPGHGLFGRKKENQSV